MSEYKTEPSRITYRAGSKTSKIKTKVMIREFDISVKRKFYFRIYITTSRNKCSSNCIVKY